MKKILVFVITLFAASSLLANEGMGNAEGGGKDGKRHQMAQLNLTDAQKTQMKALREKHVAERQAMQEKHKAAIKAILTAEQWEKFQTMRPKRPGMEEGMNSEGGNKGGNKGGNGMRGKRNMEGEESDRE